MAYVALKSRKPLLEALEDTGMKKLFTDIEMPPAFHPFRYGKGRDSGERRRTEGIRRKTSGPYRRAGKEDLGRSRGGI